MRIVSATIPLPAITSVKHSDMSYDTSARLSAHSHVPDDTPRTDALTTAHATSKPKEVDSWRVLVEMARQYYSIVNVDDAVTVYSAR
jgi:hypothetical protein